METTPESPILARLKQFMQSTGLTSTQFADKAGIPRPSMSQLLHGRNKSINNQILAKLDENFPMLNTIWLLFGRGDMLVNSNFETSEPQNPSVSAPLDGQYPECQSADEEEPAEYGSKPNNRNRNLADLLGQNGLSQVETESERQIPSGKWATSVICTPPEQAAAENRKKITSIIVFYSDNSFDTFLPSV